MKKRIALILMAMSCLPMTAQAKVGDVIGSAYNTDIVVYINNLAVPSYAVNGQSVIVAEDLRNFGFDVAWNQESRSLLISRNDQDVPTAIPVNKFTPGSLFTSILETDIGVVAGDKKITSYAMNGFTMIPVEELTMFGDVCWVDEERALKLWIDDLYIQKNKQAVSYEYYPATYAPDFGWVTESICTSSDDYYQGETYRVYSADGSDLNKYVDFITKKGWVLNQAIEGTDGRWYSGYVNKSLRTGIAVSEYEGMVTVQIGVDMDNWVK